MMPLALYPEITFSMHLQEYTKLSKYLWIHACNSIAPIFSPVLLAVVKAINLHNLRWSFQFSLILSLFSFPFLPQTPISASWTNWNGKKQRPTSRGPTRTYRGINFPSPYYFLFSFTENPPIPSLSRFLLSFPPTHCIYLFHLYPSFLHGGVQSSLDHSPLFYPQKPCEVGYCEWLAQGEHPWQNGDLNVDLSDPRVEL